jgi:transcriptional regulator GlxA family with amidase domain
MMKRYLGFAAVMTALILMLTLVSAPIRAAETAAEKKDSATSNMEILREKVKADKKLVVAANMDLTDTEAKAFWPIYQEYQAELAKANEKIGNLIGEYAENYQAMTDQTAKKLLDNSIALEKERLALKSAYLPKFEKAIPSIKVARYYQIENKIQAILQYGLAANIPLMK